MIEGWMHELRSLQGIHHRRQARQHHPGGRGTVFQPARRDARHSQHGG